MNNNKSNEIGYRRQAFKLFDKGKSATQILHKIPRSRSWLFKWKQRYAVNGWQSVAGLSKTPKHLRHAYAKTVRETVHRVRRRMEKEKVGLCGARFIYLELKEKRLVKELPAISTIKRWLREAGCGHPERHAKEAVYYPALQFPDDLFYASCDWIARYITGGAKVFAFHTLDLKTQALSQSIETDKRAATACVHLVQSLRELGLIDVLQIDNDAAFTGLGVKSRLFGQFVRVALYFGVELLFIPPREPKRKARVERVNGLWARAFWDKDRFGCVNEVRKKKEKFLKWYQDYRPPVLQGLRVSEASRKVRRRKLSHKECERLPPRLPLTAGRSHYIRRVDAAGCIEILKEKFKVSKQLGGEYVVATIDLPARSLSIYHRHSRRSTARLIKQVGYEIAEPIVRLQPRYKRTRKQRVNILQII